MPWFIDHALFIGDAERQMIDDLKERARQQPFDIATVIAATTATGEALLEWKGRLDPFTMSLPNGFLVTYTHEEQPLGLCQHLNMSVDTLGHAPSPETMVIIGQLFGMFGDDGKPCCEVVRTWIEHYPNGRISCHIVGRAENLHAGSGNWIGRS